MNQALCAGRMWHIITLFLPHVIPVQRSTGLRRGLGASDLREADGSSPFRSHIVKCAGPACPLPLGGCKR